MRYLNSFKYGASYLEINEYTLVFDNCVRKFLGTFSPTFHSSHMKLMDDDKSNFNVTNYA